MSKIALIIGGTGGFGRAIALHLSTLSYALIISGRNAEKGAEVVSAITSAGGTAEFLPCDITSVSQIRSLHAAIKDKHGRLDVAVNTAGIGGQLDLMVNQPDEEVERVFDTNIKGFYYSMQCQLRLMLPQKSGHIINLSSVYGSRGCAFVSPYAASKHAVVGMTKSAALEGAKEGVFVNALAPGIVPTGIVEGFMEGLGRAEGAEELRGLDFRTLYPVGRFGTVEDVAGAVGYLVGCDWVTGTVMEIDGGFLA